MRCPTCRRTLEQDTRICPTCRKPVIVAESESGRDRLKPRSTVSLKGVGSRMSGTPYVDTTRHRILDSEYDSSEKVRCIRCGSANDKGNRYCWNCRTRIT